MKLLLPLIAITLALSVPGRAADEPAKPLRVLMVCGGCCHDYTSQKKIISEGISTRASVEWTIVHEAAPKGSDERSHRVSIYERPGWWKGYDVVIWVNTYEKTRVFTTTLGHNNSTMEAPEYLDLVSRGLLWACGKLNDDGTPKQGYAARAK